MSENINDILISHINKIFDKDGNEILFNNIEFKYGKRKYSSTEKSLVIYIDNIPLTRNQFRSYKVEYICRCKTIHNILLCKYVYKQRLACHHCLQDRSYKDSIHTHPYSIIKGLNKKEIPQIKTFDEYDNKFKNKYEKTHLTEKEFFECLPNIYSINNIILTDEIRKKIKYCYAYPISNQLKFTSRISFDNGKTYNKIENVILRCDICKKLFNVHLINLRKQNNKNIKCRECKFNTHGYKKQIHDLTNLTYQSKLEKTFLDYCYNYGIKVENGIKIPYYFNGKLRTYVTDFYLPDHKIILELKGSNPYFINDRKSGKLDAKNASALNYAKENNMKFRFIRDYDLISFIKILSNSLPKYDIIKLNKINNDYLEQL